MAGIVFPALLLFLEGFFFKTGKAPASTNGKTPFVFTGFFLYFCIAALEAAILCTQGRSQGWCYRCSSTGPAAAFHRHMLNFTSTNLKNLGN
jgi:hypothetical protein